MDERHKVYEEHKGVLRKSCKAATNITKRAELLRRTRERGRKTNITKAIRNQGRVYQNSNGVGYMC